MRIQIDRYTCFFFLWNNVCVLFILNKLKQIFLDTGTEKFRHILRIGFFLSFFTSSYLQCTNFSTLDKYVNFWLSNLVTSFWISGISDKHQYAGMGIEIQLYLRYGSESVWFIGTAFLRAYQSNSSSSIYAAGN